MRCLPVFESSFPAGSDRADIQTNPIGYRKGLPGLLSGRIRLSQDGQTKNGDGMESESPMSQLFDQVGEEADGIEILALAQERGVGGLREVIGVNRT